MNEQQKGRAMGAISLMETAKFTGELSEAASNMAALLQELIAEQPASVPAPKSCGWIRAIDEAMVTHHLGVADIADDYEAAKNKLNTLLCLNQDIGEYFSAKAPTPSVPEPVAYQVKNGWASIAIYQRQLDAENYAKDQQKRHDLSGSLAHFYVVPLYTAPAIRTMSEKGTTE